MMLPPVPESSEDEKPRKPRLWDHAGLVPKGNIDNSEIDLQENDTDNFEHGGDPMPPSFQDPTLAVDCIQNIRRP